MIKHKNRDWSNNNNISIVLVLAVLEIRRVTIYTNLDAHIVDIVDLKKLI